MTPMRVFATAAVALLSGFVSGYALARHQLTRDFEIKVDTEVEEMRQYMSAKYGVEDTYEGSDEDEDGSSTPMNPIEAELADLKKKRDERIIGDREIKDDTAYYRYYSDGTPDKGEEGVHVDMSEDETPTKRVKKTVNSDDYQIVEHDEFNAHFYDTTFHFTYYYDEELLVDFWQNQITDEDRWAYVGDVEFERPDEYEDEADLYLINHREKIAVHINITVAPVPKEVYERHETFIKNRFKERHADEGGE